MSYCCSQCSFTAQFESALIMHHQLHHDRSSDIEFKASLPQEKSKIILNSAFESLFQKTHESKSKLGRTSSATRLFEKLRARICRSKMFVHPEEDHFNDLSAQSECTSKALKNLDSSVSAGIESVTHKESYACHLCTFEADRITVLDRHLLNDHKIGLENLLKLVMSKTKDGLNENTTQIYNTRQSYYKEINETMKNEEFIIETVTPKIKILKNAATNTDLKWIDFHPLENDKNALLNKIEILNECMCKFVDSSNTLKKVLTKEIDHKMDKSDFGLGLGDQDSPRDWERAHSEKLERCKAKHAENRSEKAKYSSESFYF